MPRLMSVAKTPDSVRNRTKTVTRRLGWTFLEPGDVLTLCPADVIAEGVPVEVFDVREVLDDGTEQPPPWEWVRWFADEMGCGFDTVVTRIEFRYLDDGGEVDRG